MTHSQYPIRGIEFPLVGICNPVLLRFRIYNPNNCYSKIITSINLTSRPRL